MSLTFLTGKAFVLPRILHFPFALINSLSVKMCKFVPILKVDGVFDMFRFALQSEL